jgi:hypothetical protein
VKNPPSAPELETGFGFPEESPPDASPLETLPVNLL